MIAPAKCLSDLGFGFLATRLAARWTRLAPLCGADLFSRLAGNGATSQSFADLGADLPWPGLPNSRGPLLWSDRLPPLLGTDGGTVLRGNGSSLAGRTNRCSVLVSEGEALLWASSANIQEVATLFSETSNPVCLPLVFASLFHRRDQRFHSSLKEFANPVKDGRRFPVTSVCAVAGSALWQGPGGNPDVTNRPISRICQDIDLLHSEFNYHDLCQSEVELWRSTQL